jgi:hypothetical protein
VATLLSAFSEPKQRFLSAVEFSLFTVVHVEQRGGLTRTS